MKKNAAARIPPAGKVTIQDANILPITRRSSAAKPRANPTPITAPTARYTAYIADNNPDDGGNGVSQWEQDEYFDFF